ncbi:MAG: VPLPA-CTERM sorting domain-containing protein [Paracoccaceae bacterium]
MKTLSSIAAVGVLSFIPMAALSAPATFIDLGNIGPAGTFTFDTLGSTDRGLVFDTVLTLFGETGTIIAENDDFRRNFTSSITEDLTDGVFFLGVTEFSVAFGQNFSVVGGSLLEPEDSGTLLININSVNVASEAFANDVFTSTNTDPLFARFEVGASAAAIPLPATGVLLIGGLAALGFTGRRRRAALSTPE